MRVESHLHITRALAGNKNCVSVRTLPDGFTKHVSALYLKDATFAVQPAGLRRFRESGQKNVHAFVRGTMVHTTMNRWPGSIDPDWIQVRYNPKENDSFVIKDSLIPVYRGKEALLIGTSVWVRF